MFLRSQQDSTRLMLCVFLLAVLTQSILLQILIYHPAFIKYVFDSWLQGHGRYPSTGILSVIFSIHVCDEVCQPVFLQATGTMATHPPHLHPRPVSVGVQDRGGGRRHFPTTSLQGSLAPVSPSMWKSGQQNDTVPRNRHSGTFQGGWLGSDSAQNEEADSNQVRQEEIQRPQLPPSGCLLGPPGNYVQYLGHILTHFTRISRKLTRHRGLLLLTNCETRVGPSETCSHLLSAVPPKDPCSVGHTPL